MRKKILIFIFTILLIASCIGTIRFISSIKENNLHYRRGSGSWREEAIYSSDNRTFIFNMTISHLEYTESLKNLDLKLLVDNKTVYKDSLSNLEKKPYSDTISATFTDGNSDGRLSAGDVLLISGDNSSYVEADIMFNKGRKNEVFHFPPELISGKTSVIKETPPVYGSDLPDLSVTDIRLYGLTNISKHDTNFTTLNISWGLAIVFNLTNSGIGDAYDVDLLWKIDGLDLWNISDDRWKLFGGHTGDVFIQGGQNGYQVGLVNLSCFTLNKLCSGESVQIIIEPNDPSSIEGMNLSGGSIHNIFISVDPNDSIPETNEANNAIQSNSTLFYSNMPDDLTLPSQAFLDGLLKNDSEQSPENDPESSMGCIIGIGFIFILPLLIGVYLGKWKIVSLMVPLYSRVKGKKVLDNFTRGQIYGMIRESPGTKYKHIKETLEMGNGTLLYHLSVLEREGFIKTETRGLRKLFYPTKIAKEDKDLDEKFPLGEDNSESFILSSFQIKLVELIRMNPKIRESDLAKKTESSRQSVNYNIKQLIRKGVVEVDKGNGKEKKLRLCDPEAS